MLPIAQHRSLGFRSHAPGFRSVSMRSEPSFDLDPFLNVDFFVMSEPTFPPHPHAGFSAVTYLLPESRGSFRNRDSLGDTSTIGPGAIHWTQAGAGMMHEEIPSTPGVEGTGFQIFVNLPAAEKGIAPRALHADATHVPVASVDGALVRVLAVARKERSVPGSRSSPIYWTSRSTRARRWKCLSCAKGALGSSSCLGRRRSGPARSPRTRPCSSPTVLAWSASRRRAERGRCSSPATRFANPSFGTVPSR